MGTIDERFRSDGTKFYQARIQIRRNGKIVFSQSQRFDRETVAKAWISRKEKELALPGALLPKAKTMSLADAIDRYVTTSRKEMGRTKAQVLEALKVFPIAEMDCTDIRSQDIMALIEQLNIGRKPQTVMNYLSHLSAVFAVARTAWGMDLDRKAIQDATEAAKRLGLVTKSASRTRRPTLDELNRLRAHFIDRSKRSNSMPMHEIMTFAIFSTRRQDEITRIKWANLEEGRVLVPDMKNPGEKMGNDVWCGLPPEAVAVIARQPKTAPEIFPYTAIAITASFTRACKILEIEDLHFHDLRHEGASRLFEMGWSIPQVATVTGHRSWQSLQRYSHLRQTGDKLANWP